MTDTHSGSRRADVWEELRAQTTDKIPNAAARFAYLRDALNTAEANLKRMFDDYERTRATLEEAGVVAQMKLSPILDAAHGAWLRDRDVPRRLELSEVSEAPIPPEDLFVDLTLTCPVCGKRADMCFSHGDDWKKR